MLACAGGRVVLMAVGFVPPFLMCSSFNTFIGRCCTTMHTRHILVSFSFFISTNDHPQFVFIPIYIQSWFCGQNEEKSDSAAWHGNLGQLEPHFFFLEIYSLFFSSQFTFCFIIYSLVDSFPCPNDWNTLKLAVGLWKVWARGTSGVHGSCVAAYGHADFSESLPRNTHACARRPAGGSHEGTYDNTSLFVSRWLVIVDRGEWG